MKQHGIGKHTVEIRVGQLKVQKILLQHITAAVGAGHGRKPYRTFKAGGMVPELCKSHQVAARTTANIEQLEGCRPFNVLQQGIDVLADVVVAGTFPETLCIRVVVRECLGGNGFKLFRTHTAIPWPA